MADDEDRSNEDADQRIDSQLIKMAEQYASCDRRSSEINDERGTIRANAEKLGIPSRAFQHAVGLVKHMSSGEQRDYRTGVNRVLKAISGRQAELFPEAAARIKKREDAAKAENKTKTRAEVDAKADANPRSDPKAGGAAAKPKGGKVAQMKPKSAPAAAVGQAAKQSDKALADSIKAVSDREQQEGAAILDGEPPIPPSGALIN